MLNYLHSEYYRILRNRAYLSLLLLSLSIQTLIFFLVFHLTDQVSFIKYDVPLSVTKTLMMGGFFIFVLLLPAVIRKERGIHIQLISFGLRRIEIFLGDYLLLIMLILITALILFLWSGINVILFFSWGTTYHIQYFSNLIIFLLPYTWCVISMSALPLALHYIIQHAAWVHVLTLFLEFGLPFIASMINTFDMRAQALIDAVIHQFFPILSLIELLTYHSSNTLALQKLIESGSTVFLISMLLAYLAYRKKEI